MPPGQFYLAVESDTLFWILNLRDDFAGDNGPYVTDATGTATILNMDGSTLTTVTMSYVSGQVTVDGKTGFGGNYRGQLPANTALVDRTSYIVKIAMTSAGSGNKLTKRVGMQANYDDVN